MTAPQLTKLFLRIFIVSIIVTAVVGIVTISIPRWQSDLDVKILLTTLTIAAASVCGLACGGCLSRGHMVLPLSGLVLTGVTAVLFLFGIWNETGSDNFWKTSLVLLFYAVACAHLSMLYMANLAGGYRWTYLIAFQLILGLSTLMAAGLLFEFFDSDSYWRLTGVIAILVAAVTLLVPVFHFLSRDKFAALQQAADPLLAVDNEIARLKNRITHLEAKRQMLLLQADEGKSGERQETQGAD